MAASADHAADLERWRSLLAEVLADREEGFVVDGMLRAGAAVGRPVLESAGLLSAEPAERQAEESENLKAYFEARGRSHT